MSKYVDDLSMRWFDDSLRKIAELSQRTMEDVLKQQAGLIARDAMRLTPPFGKNPLKEAMGTQKKSGEGAVSHDVDLVFKPLDGYGIVNSTQTYKHGNLSERIRKAVRAKDFTLAEALLNKAGLKPLAVIDKATIELHRDKVGKALRPKGRAYRVRVASSIDRLKRQIKSQIGEAKAGWLKALRLFDREWNAPKWIKRHGETGSIAMEHPHETKPAVTVGNSIDYVQDRAPDIVDLVWRVRVHAARKQVGHIERGLKAKAARELAGVTVT